MGKHDAPPVLVPSASSDQARQAARATRLIAVVLCVILLATIACEIADLWPTPMVDGWLRAWFGRVTLRGSMGLAFAVLGGLVLVLLLPFSIFFSWRRNRTSRHPTR